MKYSLMTTSIIFPMIGKLQSGVPKDKILDEYADILSNIAEIGIPAVEITSLELDLFGMDAVSAALKGAGLSVAGIIHMDQYADTDPDRSSEITEKAKARALNAKQLGAKNMMLAMMAQPDVKDYTRNQLQEALIRNIRPIAVFGSEIGVKVSVENTPHAILPVCDSNDILELIQAVPELSLTYDTGNMVVKLEDSLTSYHRCKQFVSHIHLKDMVYTADENSDLTTDGRKIKAAPHGQGMIDFPSILSALNADNYQGFLVIEYVGSENHFAQIRKAKQYFDNLI